jgi:hypothetical protein
MAKNKFNASMFDSLKEALKKTEGGGSFANIMKFPEGHTYTIRLIPNVDNIDDTFFHHFVNSWTSRSTGKYVSAISLQSFGEEDPITNQYWKEYQEYKKANPNPPVGPDGKKVKFDNPISNKEQWLVNALWVDNPANPELNGTVQILRMGYQIKSLVDDAMTGDRAEEFGPAIFDLSKDGADLKIKAEKQGDYTTFKSSFFTSKSKLDLDEDEIEKVYEQVHDLKTVYPVKTKEELSKMLEDHFFCGSEEKKAEVKKQLSDRKSKPVEEDPDDEIPMEFDEPAPKQSPKTNKKTKAEPVVDDVDELLAGLDIEE